MYKYLTMALALGCGAATLDDELADALSAWNVLEMCPAQLYEVSQAELEATVDNDDPIPEGHQLQGYADRDTCEIFIVEGIEWPRRARVIEHELGHLIRGRKGHLKCLDQPGDDLMCTDGGGPWVEGPTDRDRAFVRR